MLTQLLENKPIM